MNNEFQNYNFIKDKFMSTEKIWFPNFLIYSGSTFKLIEN